MGHDPGLTQALVIAAVGVFMMLITTIALGPVVDEFIVLGGSFDLSPWSQGMMGEVMVYGEWFYIMVKVVALTFIAYPFIYTVRRHKYRRPVDDDELWEG